MWMCAKKVVHIYLRARQWRDYAVHSAVVAVNSEKHA